MYSTLYESERQVGGNLRYACVCYEAVVSVTHLKCKLRHWTVASKIFEFSAWEVCWSYFELK